MSEIDDQPSPSENSRMPWVKKIWGMLPAVFLLGLIIFVALLFGRIQAQKKAMEAQKAAQLQTDKADVNVVALEMKPASIVDRLNLPGLVEPWVNLTVLVEVNGRVQNLFVKEGDRVRQGDVIAKIDARDYVNAHHSAKASYDAARASLRRIEELYKDQLTTRSQLDDATAQMESLKAALDSAALNLERCTLKAPIAGAINQRFIDQGQFLNHSDPVVTILQMDRVKIKVGIPESDVEAVRRLDQFKVRIDALKDREFVAKKHFLSKTADPKARLYDLCLALDNPAKEILPDMFARVEIAKSTVPYGIVVPLYAVITRNDRHVVYVVNDSKAHIREVSLGIQDGWRVQIKSGISAGDKVIVVGQRNVNDEQKVKLVRTVLDPNELAD
jgi:RND family efflux transporter MFP subunit